MKYLLLLSIFLTGCSELQLQQAASFMQELDKTMTAQKSGASSTASSSSNAYSTPSSASNTSTNTGAATTRPVTTPYSAPTTSYGAQPSGGGSASSSTSSSSYGASSSNNSNASSTRPVQTVPTAMGCVKATRPAGKQWAELYNTCSFPIEVSWCYAGTSDCKNGTWGTTSTGTIRPGGSRSASTFISQAGRYTVFYIACQGANTSAIETSATNYYCKP